MLRKFILLCILNLFIFVTTAFAATTTQEGFSFDVVSAQVNTVGTKYTAIELRISNENPTKKINVDTGFQFALADNFNNRYRSLPQPSDYTKQLTNVPPNYPSLYPGESYTTTVFFEIPLPQAESLELLVRAPALGIEKPISIPFSTGVISSSDYKSSYVSLIQIDAPLNGTVFEQGSVFQLSINLKPDELPQKLLINIFGKTIEDNAPSEHKSYNLSIPHNIPVGLSSINVIGRWGAQIASNDIVIYIKKITE